MKKYILGIAFFSLMFTTNVFAEECTSPQKHKMAIQIWDYYEWKCTTPETICVYVQNVSSHGSTSVSCILNPHFQKTTK